LEIIMSERKVMAELRQTLSRYGYENGHSVAPRELSAKRLDNLVKATHHFYSDGEKDLFQAIRDRVQFCPSTEACELEGENILWTNDPSVIRTLDTMARKETDAWYKWVGGTVQGFFASGDPDDAD
jgi:hypothetical protein